MDPLFPDQRGGSLLNVRFASIYSTTKVFPESRLQAGSYISTKPYQAPAYWNQRGKKRPDFRPAFAEK